MVVHASISPSVGPAIWLSGEDQIKLHKEIIALIERHGRVNARVIVGDKLCRVSKACQVFFMENPDGGAPILMGGLPTPVFDEGGEVEFLVQKPRDDGE